MNVMKRAVMVLLLFCLYLSSGCSSNDNDPRRTWYRRYNGTIGGKPAVIQLHCALGSLSGSYCFSNGIVVNLTAVSEEENGSLVLEAVQKANIPPADNGDVSDSMTWIVQLRDSTITGQTKDGKTITAAEQYGPCQTRLQQIADKDKAMEKKGAASTEAMSIYQYLTTTKANETNKKLLEKTQLELLGNNEKSVTGIPQYIKKQNQQYFINYRRLLKDLVIDKDATEWAYNYLSSKLIKIVYNDNCMVSLELNKYEFAGGSQGYGDRQLLYACVDMKEHRLWQLRDMLDVQPGKLARLLEPHIRKMLKIGADEPLKDYLLEPTIPVTDNMYITGTGITFCYNKKTLAKNDVWGELYIFIPYSDMKGLLKPDFRKRMNL